jgi:hypothetical protein
MRKALAIAGIVACMCADTGVASGADVKTVTVTLVPPNAAIAVDGHPRQHPDGSLELRGPLGAVFTVEAATNDASVVEKVAITDIGALPGRIVVEVKPPPRTDECTPQPPKTVPPGPPGYMTLATYPWTRVSESGRPLCITPCSKVALAPGVHALTVTNESAGLKVELSVTIKSGETIVKNLALR